MIPYFDGHVKTLDLFHSIFNKDCMLQKQFVLKVSIKNFENLKNGFMTSKISILDISIYIVWTRNFRVHNFSQ